MIHLDNAPSRAGNHSGRGRGNNLPHQGLQSSAGWPSQTGNPSGGGRDNNPPRK